MALSSLLASLTCSSTPFPVLSLIRQNLFSIAQNTEMQAGSDYKYEKLPTRAVPKTEAQWQVLINFQIRHKKKYKKYQKNQPNI